MCNLGHEIYSDLVCKHYCPGKFDDNFRNYINEIVKKIGKNLNNQKKPFTEHETITVEETSY